MAGEITYIQLSDGSIVGPDNPMPLNAANAVNSDVTVRDGTLPSNKLGVDANGRVTTTPSHGLTATTQQITGLAGAAVKFADPDATRAFVRVTNVSTHVVYYGTAGGVTHLTGAAIPIGQTEDIPHEGELYICSVDAGDKITCAFYTV